MIKMVVKKGNNEVGKTIGEQKLPKWIDDLIVKKWFLPLAVVVMLVLFVGFTLPANTRADLANNIFAKTTTDASSLGQDPASGGNNMQGQPAIGETPRPKTTVSANPASGQVPVPKEYEYNPNIKEEQIPVGAAVVSINGEDYLHFNNEMGDVSMKDYLAHKEEFDAKFNPTQKKPLQGEDSLGQKKTTDEWYPMGEANEVEFRPYGSTKITISVPDKPGYSGRVVQSDRGIYDNHQELQVQLRYKNTATGQIVYGQRAGQYSNGMGTREDWTKILGNIDPNTVQWQPIFSLKNLEVQKVTKGNLQ